MQLKDEWFVSDDGGELSSPLNPRYSPDELRYLPLNTALYEPPLDPELPALDSDGDSDDAEDGRGDEKRSKGASVRTFVFGRWWLLSPRAVASCFPGTRVRPASPPSL